MEVILEQDLLAGSQIIQTCVVSDNFSGPINAEIGSIIAGRHIRYHIKLAVTRSHPAADSRDCAENVVTFPFNRSPMGCDEMYDSASKAFFEPCGTRG